MGARTGSIGTGAAGGVAAGIALSAILLLMERQGRQPSDVVQIGRRTASLLGSPYRHGDSMPAADEQLRYHGAHLVLSAIIGASLPLLRLRGAAGGALGGIGWYGLLHGLLGPRLGLVPGPFGEPRGLSALRLGLHAAFGLLSNRVAGALRRGGARAAR